MIVEFSNLKIDTRYFYCGEKWIKPIPHDWVVCKFATASHDVESIDRWILENTEHNWSTTCTIKPDGYYTIIHFEDEFDASYFRLTGIEETWK